MLRDKVRPRHAEVTVQRRRDAYFPNMAEERRAINATNTFLADRFNWEFDAQFMDALRELLGLPIMDRADLRWKIERAFDTGELVVVPDAPPPRRSAHVGAPAVLQPASRAGGFALTPSQAFGRVASVAAVARSFAPLALPRNPTDDFFAIMAANPGDVLPDGTIATALTAEPFEYVPDTLDGDVLELAGRGVSMTGNEPGGFRLNPNGLDVDYFDANGNLCAQFHGSHGDPHGHNFWDGVRDNSHLPMSSINCR